MRTIAFLATLPIAESMTWTFGKALQVPPQPDDKRIPYAHGLEVDKGDRVFLTYWDWNTTRRACLIRWDPAGDARTDPNIVGNGDELPMCVGGTGSYGTDSVHGIRIAEEPCEDGDGTCEYMYHANNNQGLFKTDLDGNLKWATYGEPGKPASGVQKPTSSFTPTWFDKQPGSKYLYLADGYGSSKIYVYDTDGKYQDIAFDGTENDGKRFHTPHAISWDPRVQKMVVSDRSNHRLVYYDIDQNDPTKFMYSSELAVEGSPCNMRFWTAPSGERLAVVPVLEGKVYVYDGNNTLLHTINVTDDMQLRKGHDDPHDAIFTQQGDIVVGTYADGYVGYYRFDQTPAPPSSATCSKNAGCVAVGLTDDNHCCPTDDGTMLACCDQTPAPPSSATCSKNAGCVAVGLTDDNNCCPTDDGMMLACCDQMSLVV